MTPRQLIPAIMLLLALCSGSARAGEHCGHHEPDRPSSHTHSTTFGDRTHDHKQVTLCAPEQSPCDHHCCEMHHDAPISVSMTLQHRTHDRPHNPMPWRGIPSLSPRAPPTACIVALSDARQDDHLRLTQTIVLLN